MIRPRLRACGLYAAGCLAGGLFALVVLVVAIRVTFDAYRQSSGSMEPTLASGDLVLTRPAGQIRRGDLIVFVGHDGRNAMKRVVGLPDERIEVRERRAIINGVPLTEPYLADEDRDVPAAADFGPAVVAPNRYFVLGDNRDNSHDSRYFGPLSPSAIRGRVVLVLCPDGEVWRP